eukprot:2028492-Rhodomonas_salina.2
MPLVGGGVSSAARRRHDVVLALPGEALLFVAQHMTWQRPESCAVAFASSCSPCLTCSVFFGKMASAGRLLSQVAMVVLILAIIFS